MMNLSVPIGASLLYKECFTLMSLFLRLVLSTKINPRNFLK